MDTDRLRVSQFSKLAVTIGKLSPQNALNKSRLCMSRFGQTAERDLNAAKNIERWFEGIFIPGRSDKMASYAKIACEVDKHLERHLTLRRP